jgi:hypothetical protein
MIRSRFRPVLFLALLLAAFALSGCSDSSSDPVGTMPEESHDHDRGDAVSSAAPAWIWGYQTEDRVLTAYHSDGGRKRATFAAHAHPNIQIAYAPSDSAPTIWMGSGSLAQAFTAGFYPHGDHGHMETPRKRFTLAEVHRPAHMSVSHDGRTAVFANDETATFTLVDVETGAVSSADHGSPHSSALMTARGHLVATHMQENWARIVDPVANAVLAEIPIGSRAHGDAYHAGTGRAFIAVEEGIEIIDTVSMNYVGRLPYEVPGRTSFLYHSGDNPVAVGPHNWMEDGERRETDRFLLVHMGAETLESVPIPGASLAHGIRNGNFALSRDGKTGAFADLKKPLLYVVDLDPDSPGFKNVRTVDAPSPAVAVGVNHDGRRGWILSGNRIYPVRLDEGILEMDGVFAVKEGTEWLFVTSVPGEILDDSVDRGDAILNPEDAISGV